MHRSPLSFLLLLQVGLLLVGTSGVLLLELPWGQPSVFRDPLLALGILLALRGLEGIFRRLFPSSWQEAESLHRALGEALKRQGVRPGWLLALALLSGVAEEVFFRGLVQSVLVAWLGWPGVLAQALLFALLHPAPPRAFAYPLYTGLAGLLLGATYHLTGSLLPGALAHFLHNAWGFYEALR